MFQANGNLVLQDDAGHPIWTTDTWSADCSLEGLCTLHVQDDGNVVIYDSFTAIWATKTGRYQ